MSEITWIKLVTNVYTNKKINQIRKMKNGDSFFTVWIILMCIAGDANADGEVVIAQDMPYTDEMLASEMREPLEIVKEALAIFERFKMIVRTDGVIKLANWEKYQSVDRMAEIREYNRLAQQRSRASRSSEQVNDNQSECQTNVNDMSMTCQTNVNDKSMTSQRCQDTDKDKDIEVDIDVDADAEGEGDAEGGGTETVPASAACPYAKIKEMYHLLCPSFPTIKSIDGSRRKAVAARWRTNPSRDTFRELFMLAENSSFLKGANDRNWTADFDWMMKQSNFTKIMEHRYDDKDSYNPSPPAQSYRQSSQPHGLTLESSFDADEAFTAALRKSYGGYDPRESGITYGENSGGEE